jgi:hypothetical protein
VIAVWWTIASLIAACVVEDAASKAPFRRSVCLVRSKSETAARGRTARKAEPAQKANCFTIALGHKVGDQVQRAYARGDALKKRVSIMESWAQFCAKPQQPGKVISLQSRGA